MILNSVQELVELSQQQGISISEAVIRLQLAQDGGTREELLAGMHLRYHVMQDSVKQGLKPGLKSLSGLSGGDAFRMQQVVDAGQTIGGTLFGKLLGKALAVSEYNATMGRIVAAPTAGSCGILPAVLISLQEERGLEEQAVVLSLFTCAGIGMVIQSRASLSGAVGGCQAECGSASAMAAAAAVEILGGTPEQAAQACAMALKNNLGLACDPVGGLVEVPCIKRNASGAANALVAAEMALAGIRSAIPPDEVIDAMRVIGNLMDSRLKETAMSGLATTPTGLAVKARMVNP